MMSDRSAVPPTYSLHDIEVSHSLQLQISAPHDGPFCHGLEMTLDVFGYKFRFLLLTPFPFVRRSPSLFVIHRCGRDLVLQFTFPSFSSSNIAPSPQCPSRPPPPPPPPRTPRGTLRKELLLLPLLQNRKARVSETGGAEGGRKEGGRGGISLAGGGALAYEKPRGQCLSRRRRRRRRRQRARRLCPSVRPSVRPSGGEMLLAPERRRSRRETVKKRARQAEGGRGEAVHI